MCINSISNSSLNTQDRQLAYSAFLRPQIGYPIGCASIATRSLKRLFCPVMDVILHTLGLNKHFPLDLVHEGPESLGLGIDNMAMVQGIDQLQLLLGNLNKTDCTGTLIIIALSYLELEIGLGKCPLGHPHTTTLEHVTMTWITSIAHFLHRTGC